MTIYVFQRPTGQLWADFNKEFAERAGKVVHTIAASTRAEMEGVIKDPGPHLPERVRALAERALSEFLERHQQPTPIRTAPPPIEPPPEAKPRPWWRRLFGG